MLLTAALAPAAWGSGYYVTDAFLPPDRPFFGALVRALPFGLLLLGFRRRLPQGAWWWRAALLGTVNIGAFFVLIFVAAYRLPGGIAATLTATSPFAVAVTAWWIAGERPRRTTLVGAGLGVAGVVLLVAGDGFALDPVGVAASLGAVALFALGTVLVKRWEAPVDMLTLTAWQLVAGGLVLFPVALVVEGPPPALDGRAVVGFLYLGLFGTVVAYVVWFRAVQRLPVASVALVGLLNPVTGTVLGVVLAGEVFGPAQAAGTGLVLGGILLGQRAPAVPAPAELGLAPVEEGRDGVPVVARRAQPGLCPRLGVEHVGQRRA